VASISQEELLRLARAGATARVHELQTELQTIYSAFPDLRSGVAAPTRSKEPAARRARKTAAAKRAWSAADRKAVSDRMKKYWAARRAKAGKARASK
jgi:hypothetical protein